MTLWASLAVVTVVCVLGCRSPGPASRGARRLELTDIDGYVEAVVTQREQEQGQKVADGGTRSKETIFEENVRLDTEGHFYHPNLLEFALGGLFGLIQEDYEEHIYGRERSSSDDGTVIEFDLEAQILRRKKYPATVFAHRRRGLVPRPFLPSLETTTTDYGATWQYVSDRVPTRFQFHHSDVRLSPLFLSGDAEQEGRQKNTEFRFDTAYNFSDHNTLSFVYERESVEEQPYEIDYDSDEFRLAHRLEFGDQHQHRLDSDLEYLDQRGTLALERTRWRETLQLRHSKTLRSRFRLEALDRTRGTRSRELPPLEERSLYFSGSLEHQLYESLHSQFLAFVQTQEFDPALEIDRYGAQADFNYRKRNRWGTLHANYGIRVERDDHRGEAQITEVIDELHVFRDPEPVVLGNPNIDAGSITIRAQDRVTFYQRQRDYTVQAVGDRVEIRRVPTGHIVDGQAVLIDYVFSLGGAFKLDTISQDFGIRQAFDFGLTPYYRLESRDQTLSPREAVGAVPDDVTAHILGVEFERWSLRLFAEYEDRDSTIDPFDAIRLGAFYTHRFRSGATANLGARWTDTDHHPPNEREVTFFTVDGRYRHPITSNLTVEASALYRMAEDSLSGDDDGLDLAFSVEWLIRKTEVRATFDFGQFEDDFARNESSTLYVQVRRRF